MARLVTLELLLLHHLNEAPTPSSTSTEEKIPEGSSKSLFRRMGWINTLVISGAATLALLLLVSLCLLFVWKKWRRKSGRMVIFGQTRRSDQEDHLMSRSPSQNIIRSDHPIAFILPTVNVSQQVPAESSSMVSGAIQWKSRIATTMRRSNSADDVLGSSHNGHTSAASLPRQWSMEKFSIDPQDIQARLYSDQLFPHGVRREKAKVGFGLFYEVAHEMLYVRVLGAQNLPQNQRRGCVNPYARVSLIPGKFRKQMTRVRRNTTSPVFNDEFCFCVKRQLLQHKFLKIKLFDFDRVMKETLLGSLVYPIKESGITEQEVGHFGDVGATDIWRPLEEARPEAAVYLSTDSDTNVSQGQRGQLEISLRYDESPEPGMLTLQVVQAKDLSLSQQDKKFAAVYVKVTVLERQQAIKAKKTRVVRRTSKPVFDDTFNIQLPFTYLSEVNFIFNVFSKTRLGAKTLLGSTSVGPVPYVSGPGVDHWNDMTHQKGRNVIRWHPL